MESARRKPPARMTTPAIAVPVNATRSVAMCRYTASTLRLRRLARDTSHVVMVLTVTPASATKTSGAPPTRTGLTSRTIASTTMKPASVNRAMPLASAERISARFRP